MDFGWNDDQVRYRLDVRAFVEANAPGWTHEDRDVPDDKTRDASLVFCQALARRGWLTPQLPKQYGGTTHSEWERVILAEEMWAHGEPRGPQYMNSNWIAPAILMAGTEEQKDFHLGRIAAGDVLWCQGFSEPGAGSDLASLRTRAVRDGEFYIVNGQKLWTSYAHQAEYCFLLVRTNPDAERHHGISILLVPMDLPGIELRDVRTPFVEHLVHEAFFRDVRVPLSCRLGPEDQGWDIITRTLSNERIGVPRYAYSDYLLQTTMEQLSAACSETDSLSPEVAEDLGAAFAFAEAARTLMYVSVHEMQRREEGHYMAAVWRAMGAGFMEVYEREALMRLQGDEGLVDATPADKQVLMGTVGPIVAGALEIQLGVVARQCLKLPKAV
jgi:alkylation response protein AidB-like acyl-CoA dehydrogenase